MKKRSILNLIITFLFGVMFSLFWGCGGAKLTEKRARTIKGAEVQKAANGDSSIVNEVVPIKSGENMQPESIYPKEYQDPWGRERYQKIREGVYVYSKSHSGREYDLELTRFDFFDKSGKMLKSYDVRANNPYNKASVPTLIRDNYESYIYDSYIPKAVTQGKPEFTPTEHFTRSQMPSSQIAQHAVVGYHLLGVNNGPVVDWKFTAVCMDEKGDVLRIFNDLDIDPYEFCMSEDKKFFCVSYGGLRGESLTRLRNNGFRIYEIETGQLVYELNVDDQHRILGPSPDDLPNKLFYGSVTIEGNDFANDLDVTFNKIDFANRRIFSKKIQDENLRMIKGADIDGFFMESKKTGEKWKLLYAKDFQIEKF